MTKPDERPKFMMPGDNPELDRLVAELKKDCDDGDPLYKNYRTRMAQAAAGATIVVREKPVEAQPKEPPSSKRRMNTRWIGLAVLGIVGPIAALTLGVLRARGPEIIVGPSGVAAAPPAPAITAASAATSAGAVPSVEASAAPALSAPAAPEPRQPARSRKRPSGAADAGAAELEDWFAQ